jgi:biotin operon repressor
MDNLYIKLHRDKLRDIQDLSRASILVFLELQFYMIGDDQIECWPSQARLAEDLGMAARTVRKAISDLKEKGIIIVDTDKRLTNTMRNGERKKEEEQKILTMPTPARLILLPNTSRGSNDPIHEDQSCRTIGSNDPIDEDQTCRLKEEKKKKKEKDIKKEKKHNVREIAQALEVDKRNLWIEALLGEHAISLGWNTNDMIADIDSIKGDYSILSVERGCKSLDIFIRDGRKHNLFRGRGWVQGLINWIGREPTGKLSESKAKKYARSVLTIDFAAAQKESKEAIESVEKSQALALVDHGGVRGIWGALCKRHDMNYEAIEKEIVEMIKNGTLTTEMQQEIKQHEDLLVFDALIDTYINYDSKYEHGGRYNV